MNIGDGVPCTIEYQRTGDLVRHPDIEDESFIEKQHADIERTLYKQMEYVRKIASEFDDMANTDKTPTKKSIKEMNAKLQQIISQMPGHAKFMAESMTEHFEHAVMVAKTEVGAYVTRKAMQFPGLIDHAPEMPAIEDHSNE